MKRFLILLLSLMLVLSFSACDVEQTLNNASQLAGAIHELEEAASDLESPEDLRDDREEQEANPIADEAPEDADEAEPQAGKSLDPDGYYYDLENVVLYLDTYGELPPNYITKEKAEDLGWQGGSVERYQDGAAIGGNRFGNREGQLPKADGRKYTECDLDTDGKDSRGPKRLVFSNDGLYFYTEDHYESFQEVYVTDEGTVEWK